MNNCYKGILDILNELNISDYESVDHPEVFTCEEADKYCSNPDGGLKNLLIKTKNHIFLCVILGKSRLSKDKVRTLLGQKFSFVGTEDATSILDCELGAIPSFGKFNQIKIIADKNILEQEVLYLNPGINTKTIGVKTDDFKKIIDYCNIEIQDISE